MTTKNPINSSLAIFCLILTTVACSPSKKSGETAKETSSEPIGIVEQEVDYQSDTLNMKGYLVYDGNQEGKRPGILVVHEWWGHNDYARKRAKMLAEMGYTALAVDMYGDGKTADHPEQAGAFMNAVLSNIESAQARFESALVLLKSQESVDSSKIAAIGYCFGGGVVLHMARFGLDLDGVVSFHGGLSTKMPAEQGKVLASVLVCHGADDPFVKPEHIDGFKQEMDAAGVDYTFEAYEGAKHSFTNPEADTNGERFGLPLAYNEEADKKSWQSMQDFFNKIFAD